MTTSSRRRAPTATGSSTSATTPGWSSRACPIEEFEARREQAFWTTTREIVGRWDELIDEFNEQVTGRPA